MTAKKGLFTRKNTEKKDVQIEVRERKENFSKDFTIVWVSVTM